MRAIYIVSDSRSGSTLLHHLLSLQTGVIGLGEVHRLETLVRTGESCACGRSLQYCPFWNQIALHVGRPLEDIRTTPAFGFFHRRYAQLVCWVGLRFGLERLAHRLLGYEQRAAANCTAIYRAVVELTGNHVVVDSSKIPSHFMHLYLEDKEVLHPVFLVRDGRGVVWSKMRRTGINVEQATRLWLNVHRMTRALQRVLPNDHGAPVHYEEWCAKPKEVLGRILGEVGLSVESVNLALLRDDRHDLGGSPGFRGKKPSGIVLDNRWQSEMGKDALLTFERIAGSVNRKLGYD